MSSVDWPGELAATVFLQGCPWRCAYCHNQHLLSAEVAADTCGTDAPLSWEDVREFLASRVGLLDGVVFSGGEPLAQPAVADAIAESRSLGLKVALHTGGVVPERLEALLPQLSWVGFDVKAPWDAYERITGAAGSGERARASLQALVRSGVAFEARTTVHADLLSEDDLRQMARELAAAGVGRWVLQPFRCEGSPLELPHAAIDFAALTDEIGGIIGEVALR